MANHCFFMIQYKSNLVQVVTSKILEILCTLAGGLWAIGPLILGNDFLYKPDCIINWKSLSVQLRNKSQRWVKTTWYISHTGTGNANVLYEFIEDLMLNLLKWNIEVFHIRSTTTGTQGKKRKALIMSLFSDMQDKLEKL